MGSAWRTTHWKGNGCNNSKGFENLNYSVEFLQHDAQWKIAIRYESETEVENITAKAVEEFPLPVAINRILCPLQLTEI